MTHEVCDTIEAYDPSQSLSSRLYVERSLCRILILYESITLPLLSGAVQSIVRLVPLREVVGGSGWSGT
jgi:hypothetical protein